MTYLNRVERKALGDETERKFFEALKVPIPSLPKWIYDIRQATLEEDLRGTDAVADTDVGEVYIQIKRSLSGMERHVAHYGEKNHLVIVIRPGLLSLVAIRIRTFDLMDQWRRKEKRRDTLHAYF